MRIKKRNCASNGNTTREYREERFKYTYLYIWSIAIHESCAKKGVKPVKANHERRISQEIFIEGRKNGSRYRLNFVFTTPRSKDALALSFLRLVPPDYHRNRSSKSSSNLGTSCPRCFSRYARVITKEIVSFARNRLWEVTESGMVAWRLEKFYGLHFDRVNARDTSFITCTVLIYSYRYLWRVDWWKLKKEKIFGLVVVYWMINCK